MLENVKNALLYLKNAVQAGKIYTENHPKYKEFIQILFQSIQEVLKHKSEFIIGVIDGEMAWENEIFFELSDKMHGLATFMEGSRIQRVVFQQGVDVDELSRFIAFLTRTKRLDQIDEREYFSLHGIRNIRAGRVKSAVKLQGLSPRRAEMAREYTSQVQTVRRSLNVVLDAGDVDYLDLRFNLLGVMEHFMGKHQDLLSLVDMKKADVATFSHLLNVSVLSMFLASKLKFAREEVLDVGIAALYHDIGKLAVDRKLIKKKGKLEESEFVQVKEHPYIGAQILYDYREGLGSLPMIVAFEHHVRYDLSGYPKLAYPRRPHIASLIVTIADVYDALAQKRSYKKDYPPDRIYAIMTEDKGKTFDPQLLDRFFEIVGVWPVGSIVALTDGRVGLVTEVNEKAIRKPKVRIISEPEKAVEIDLASEETLAIEKALNPKKEGKKYLKLLESGALDVPEAGSASAPGE
jgi:putative nucleotidyltransferase with HDIG domain